VRRRREQQEEPPKRLFPGRAILFLAVATLVVKALVLAHFHSHPLLQPVGEMDSGAYARLASRVSGGDLLLRSEGPVPFFVSPLYIYFLAAIHALSGGSLLAAKVVQIVLGTAAVGLMFAAVRRFAGTQAAWITALFLALTGTLTFHEVVILQAALDPFLTALALFLLARALTLEGPNASKVKTAMAFGFTGLALGLFALNRPNVLLCAAALVILLPFVEGFRRGLTCAGALILGCGLAIAPATFRNLAVSREPVLISSHGGLNFYIGNNATADGTYHHIKDITPSIEGQARDAKKVAEAAEGRTLTTTQVSRHFARLAFAWMREHPADAARLFLRKLAFTVNAEEITLDYSYAYYSREKTSVLTFLFVGAGLLVPLGLVGLAVRAMSAPHSFLIWASFVPVYALSIAIFFVSARYRLPLLIPLAAGAGMLFDRAAVWLKERRFRALVVAAAAVVPLAVLAALNFHLDDGVDREETEYVLYLIDQKDYAAARNEIERVAPHHRQPGVLHYRVGLALQYQERHADAITAFRQAISFEPERKEIQFSLAASEEKLAMEHVLAGKTAEGMRELEEAVRLDPAGASARQNLAALYAEAGRFEEARALAREALRLNPGYPQAEALLKALESRK
jgi:Flp pilus assembly protein TadD